MVLQPFFFYVAEMSKAIEIVWPSEALFQLEHDMFICVPASSPHCTAQMEHIVLLRFHMPSCSSFK